MFTVTKSVREVRLDFMATDSNGRSVPNLTPADFQIFDDNTPVSQFTAFRTQADLPVHIAVLIDSSGSTERQLQQEKELALRFLGTALRPGDLATIAGFSTRLNSPEKFTEDLQRLEASLPAITPGGLTALHDSLTEFCEHMYPQTAREVRRVLVLISDGADSYSRYSLRESLTAALKADIVVYSIGILNKASDLRGQQMLKELSQNTGGRTYFIQKFKHLDDTFGQIDRDLRSYYSVSYKAPEVRGRMMRPVAVRPLAANIQIRSRSTYFLDEQ